MVKNYVRQNQNSKKKSLNKENFKPFQGEIVLDPNEHKDPNRFDKETDPRNFGKRTDLDKRKLVMEVNPRPTDIKTNKTSRYYTTVLNS